MTVYRILYRGSLSSCNFGCDYCPFAKTTNTREELRQDAREVNRFVDWVAQDPHSIGVFFTPWGEAIIHDYYRIAMVKLSQMPHVQRVAMQTNLSCRLDDLATANREKLALWATYHPTQTTLTRFLQRCKWLIDHHFRFSVGVVGIREHFESISELRKELPAQIYVWVNCYKRESDYYRADELDFIKSIDPYFELNRHYYPSAGESCNAGSTSFTVDGRGDVRRCHFIADRIGNLYEEDIFQRLAPRLCPNQTCGCHIGYVHRPAGNLNALFGENILERIPYQWPALNPDFFHALSAEK